MIDFKLLILILMIVILAIVLIYSVIIVSKKKQYYAKIDDLDYMKHEISNQTVPFELAKLRSTKKSERIVKLVQQWERRWGKLESDFIMVTEQIIYTEELVADKSFSEADEQLMELQQTLDGLKEEVEQLIEEIKALKKSEERNRSNVIALKDSFEQLKFRYETEEEKYSDFKEEMKTLFKDVEVFFLKFNECMDDCNYDLADETLELIKSHIETITYMFERAPLYRETLTNELKPLLREVLKSYETIISSGVYLKHLQIKETISYYHGQLEEIPQWIKRFDFERIEATLLEIHDNAKQMIEFMKKEYDLQTTVKEMVMKMKVTMQQIKEQGETLNARYENIKDNYRLPEEEEQQFNLLLNELKIVNNEFTYLLGRIEENQTANSTLVRELTSMGQQGIELKEQLRLFDGEIEGLYAGEKECRQKALMLLKTFNQLKGMYHQVRFPIENEETVELIKRANFSVQLLFDTIGRLPINIAEIDKQLTLVQASIDELSTRVETEVLEAQLAERLMIYGHRYIEREGMYVVDLTIAEDQFRQGNYATVIKKMYELLKEVEGASFEITFKQFKQQVKMGLV